jgi:dipeptidyl aminopeptidase/acylaminoacyl peptidase
VAIVLAGAAMVGLVEAFGLQHRTPVSTPTPTPTLEPTDLFARAHGRIVYTTDPYTDSQQLAAVDPTEPGDTVSLGPVDGGLYANPIAWSSDGTRLLLLRDRPDGRDLSVLSSDGSETVLQRGFVFGASFSPDGSRVVYGANGGLYVVDADGGTPRLLAEGSGGDLLASPAWSPDGSRIAFIDGGGEGELASAAIVVVRSDGTDRKKLVDQRELGQEFSWWGLSWSPDGSRLAFAVGTGSPSGPRGSIYVVDADGSGLQEVTSPGEASWPVWSPDGSRLAFVCLPHGDDYANLCIMPVAGGDVARFEDVSFVMDDSLRTFAWNPVTQRVP